MCNVPSAKIMHTVYSYSRHAVSRWLTFRCIISYRYKTDTQEALKPRLNLARTFAPPSSPAGITFHQNSLHRTNLWSYRLPRDQNSNNARIRDQFCATTSWFLIIRVRGPLATGWRAHTHRVNLNVIQVCLVTKVLWGKKLGYTRFQENVEPVSVSRAIARDLDNSFDTEMDSLWQKLCL